MGQHALPGDGFISQTGGDFALPAAWIFETETITQLPRVFGGIAGVVAGPSAAVAVRAYPVPFGGAVARSSGLAQDWLIETDSKERALGFGWVSENPTYTGIAGDLAGVVPIPAVALHGNLYVKATLTGGPQPFAALVGSMPVIEIGQIFDNPPAPSSSIVALAIEQAVIAEVVAAPVAALSGTIFNTKFADLLGAVPAPAASVSVFVVQTLPSGDIDGRVPAPSGLVAATMYATAVINSAVDAPAATVNCFVTHSTFGDIQGVVDGPSAAMFAGLTNGCTITTAVAAPVTHARGRIFSEAVFEESPVETFTVHPDLGEGRAGFADDYRPR